MKRVVVIIDGAGDHPLAALGNKTPLEYAHVPNMSFLAARGRVGLVDSVYPDLPVESIVAALGILGYDPHAYFPNGRASFEAAAAGVRLGPGDLAFRCNLISTEADRITDFTAGLIDDAKAKNLILGLPKLHPSVSIIPSQSYRNILIYRDAQLPACDFVAHAPHENIGRSIHDLWLRGKTTGAEAVAQELNAVLRESVGTLATMNEDLQTRASMLWLWSPSDSPKLPAFRTRYGHRGAVVSGLHFLRGIGLSAQMLTADVPGATGYIDSNLAGKAKAAMELLREVDVVVVHLNAADEEAHQRNLKGKIAALELFDEVVIGPLARHLLREYPDDHRMAVLPDHYTCVENGHHIVHPVPCLVWGTAVTPDATSHFGEREAAQKGSFHVEAPSLLPALLQARFELGHV